MTLREFGCWLEGFYQAIKAGDSDVNVVVEKIYLKFCKIYELEQEKINDQQDW